MSLKFKRPSKPQESLITRKSLLSPDFSGTVEYLDRLKPRSIREGVLVTSVEFPNPTGVITVPKYDGYVESRYVQTGYVENTD